jgi:branched-chain amino acid transport system ATP-binding protein
VKTQPARQDALGGEQQMLAIGRGLMTNPDCLIMDEPSEGLAPIIIQGLWEAIGKLKQEGLPSCWSSRTPRSPSSWSTTCT